MLRESKSPYKPGTAEDLTFRAGELAAERNTGEAMMTVSTGLGRGLLLLFRLPVLAYRALRWVLASGTVLRWTLVTALIASGLGLALSLAMQDEIGRAQVRFVPVGVILGLVLGLIRQRSLRKSMPKP